MEIETALTTQLLSKTALTALINRRFHFDEAPKKEQYPYVVMTNISDVKDHIFNSQCVLEHPSFQFTVYAESKLAAKAVCNQIKTALYKKEREITGITVQRIRLLNELYSKYTAGDGIPSVDTGYLEYEIWYERND
jgi:hypothetical protein